LVKNISEEIFEMRWNVFVNNHITDAKDFLNGNGKD